MITTRDLENLKAVLKDFNGHPEQEASLRKIVKLLERRDEKVYIIAGQTASRYWEDVGREDFNPQKFADDGYDLLSYDLLNVNPFEIHDDLDGWLGWTSIDRDDYEWLLNKMSKKEV